MTKRAAKKRAEDVGRAAVITPDHARDRLLGAGAGAGKAGRADGL